MTADQIIATLREKHSEDVFVAECNTGATSGRFNRMDAWVMPKSWAHPQITAYEVKVSRSDFINDKKWPSYLDYCNLFYFVAPKGIIKESEVPPAAGLMEVVGKRAVTRKKAPHRQVDIPQSVFRYVIMSRSAPPSCNQQANAGTRINADFWRAWLKDKAGNRELGYSVARAIREEAHAIKNENRKLRDQNLNFENVRQFIRRLGLDPEVHGSWNVENRVRELTQLVPPDLARQIEQLQRALRDFDYVLKERTKQPTQDGTPAINQTKP